MQEKAAFTNRPCVGSVYAEDDVVKDKWGKLRKRKAMENNAQQCFVLGKTYMLANT